MSGAFSIGGKGVRLGLFLALCGGAVPCGRAQQNTGELDVGVRAEVDPAARFERKKNAAPESPKLRIYAILQVQQRQSDEKLVKPVDPEMIARELDRQLGLQGFRRVPPQQKPEIVVTAEYGRSWLRNPYLGGASVLDDGQNSAPVVTMDGGSLTQMMKQKGPFIEAKIQKASYEKLFIQVKAWKYPSSPSEKPRVLWSTLMNVDDPDHRDLNTVYQEMFAAGAPYFDRRVEDEVDVYRPLPEGNVKIGTPTEVTTPPGTGK